MDVVLKLNIFHYSGWQSAIPRVIREFCVQSTGQSFGFGALVSHVKEEQCEKKTHKKMRPHASIGVAANQPFVGLHEERRTTHRRNIRPKTTTGGGFDYPRGNWKKSLVAGS